MDREAVKVAIATYDKEEAFEFRRLLCKKYSVTKYDENIRSSDGLFIGLYTAVKMDTDTLDRLCGIIGDVTGTNPLDHKGKNTGRKSKAVATIIMHYRYGLGYKAIGKYLGYLAPVQPYLMGRNFNFEKNMKTMPIERLIVRIHGMI